MKIIVKSDFEESFVDSLLELFCELKGCNDMLVFEKDSSESASGDIIGESSNEQNDLKTTVFGGMAHPSDDIEIEIRQISAERFILKADALDFISNVERSEIEGCLQKIVAGCLGYRALILRGLCVKDSDGNRIKPEITLYAYKDLGLTIPSAFEYTKEVKQNIGPSFDFQTVTLSPIIKGLLEKTALSFKSGNTTLTVTREQNTILSRVTCPPIRPVADALLGCSVMEGVRKVLNSQYTQYTKNLRQILLYGGSESEVVSFYKKLPSKMSRVDFEYLTAVVETFPKLYDSRDMFISELQEFLQSHAQRGPGILYEYLEVKHIKRIRKNIKYSLCGLLK